MYKVQITRRTIFLSDVYVDVFTTDSYGFALNMFDYFWGLLDELKREHRDIWVQIFDKDGKILKEDKWSFPGKLPIWMTRGGK